MARELRQGLLLVLSQKYFLGHTLKEGENHINKIPEKKTLKPTPTVRNAKIF